MSDPSSILSRRLLRDEVGTASVEYTVLLVCIVVVGLATWNWFGEIVIAIIGPAP